MLWAMAIVFGEHPSTRRWQFSLLERLEAMANERPQKLSDVGLITVIEAADTIKRLKARYYPKTLAPLGPRP